MANLTQTISFILYLTGAMLIAVGARNNPTGLWVFAIPTAIHSKNRKSLYPPRKYLLRNFLPGGLLATIGLICYAFFETKGNYFLVHSFWHATIALSVLLLLPMRRDESCKQNLGLTIHILTELYSLSYDSSPFEVTHSLAS
ncbi:hypothetical protein Anas_01351, partial [Armadillidium nasatum]